MLFRSGNTRYVRGTLNQCIRMAYLFVLPIILFFILCPNWILRIYTDMPDLISASLPSLFVLCSAYIFIVPGNVYFQSVSGTGNTRAAFILELMGENTKKKRPIQQQQQSNNEIHMEM